MGISEFDDEGPSLVEYADPGKRVMVGCLMGVGKVSRSGILISK